MKSWIEILIRSVSFFILTLFFMRVLGKSNTYLMSPFKFVTYVVIAVIVSLTAVNIITNLAFGLIALGVWIFFGIALDYLTVKSKWIHDLVYGRGTVLIKNGKVMEENLIQARLTGEELLSALRSKNAFNLADVEFAVMESNGEVNVLLKSDKKPVTPHDLGKKVAPQVEQQTVILDGNIIDESLSNIGLNRGWLNTQLEGLGIALENVFLCQVDTSGDLYLDLFDDNIQTSIPKVKEMLYANLQKVYSDLLKFALETKDVKARSMYSNNSDEIKEVIRKLEPYLLR